MSPVRQLNCSSLRFLIVDPESFYRSILGSVFRGFGAKTTFEAGTAEAALQIFHNHDIHLIVTEWARLGAPAEEMIKAIRTSSSRNFMLPVFVVTSETTRRNVSAARDAGANEVLAKPISTRALFDRLYDVVTNPRVFVRTDAYLGPDRRRFRSTPHDGPRRREDDEADANRSRAEPTPRMANA